MTVRALLLTIPLQPGEGALAYLSRLTARNGVPSARSFCTDWGLNFGRLVDGCPGELGRLAALSDVPVAELVAASIRKDGKAYHVRGERMVASSLRLIGALSLHGRGVHLKRVDETELHLAGSVGIGIAGGGERALQHFLRTLRRDYPYGFRVRSGPRAPFTEFQAWLTGHSRDEDYEPVRALLRRHLAEPKPVDIKDKPRVFPGSNAAVAYAVIMSKRPRIIRDRVPRYPPDSPVMPSTATASPSAPPAREVSLTDAARRLTCGLALLLTMIAHRMLLPIVGGGEAYWRHTFSNDDLDALLAHMMAGTTQVPEVPDGVIGLYEGATRLLCAPVEILRLVLGRCFVWVGRLEGIDGVGSLLFRQDELESLVQSQDLKGPTLPEAAAFLGLEIDGVERLIGMGALTKEEGLYAYAGIPVAVVPASSFDEFVAANVDLRLVAQRMRLKPVNAIEVLSRSGLRSTYASADPEFAFYDRLHLAKTQPGFLIHRPILWSPRVPEMQFR